MIFVCLIDKRKEEKKKTWYKIILCICLYKRSIEKVEQKVV